MPYRTNEPRNPPPPPEDPPPGEDNLPLWLVLAVSLIGLIPKLFAGGDWGAEPTLALLLAVASASALIRSRLG